MRTLDNSVLVTGHDRALTRRLSKFFRTWKSFWPRRLFRRLGRVISLAFFSLWLISEGCDYAPFWSFSFTGIGLLVVCFRRGWRTYCLVGATEKRAFSPLRCGELQYSWFTEIKDTFIAVNTIICSHCSWWSVPRLAFFFPFLRWFFLLHRLCVVFLLLLTLHRRPVHFPGMDVGGRILHRFVLVLNPFGFLEYLGRW